MTEVVENKKKGMIPAIIGCVSGVLAILTIGIVFFPIALISTIIALILTIKSRNGAGVGVSVLALILTILGFVFSPTLWVLFLGVDEEYKKAFEEAYDEATQEIEKTLQELEDGDTSVYIEKLAEDLGIDTTDAYEVIG